MYLRRIALTNIKSFRKLEWKLPGSNLAGWHVIIGDNGAGKTCFVRSMALALVGPREAAALPEDWHDWIRRGESTARIDLELVRNPRYDTFTRHETKKSILKVPLQFEHLTDTDEIELVCKPAPEIDPRTHIWSGRSGWFSAAYGPFRRFQGSDSEYQSAYFTKPRLSRHLSVFTEAVALTESIKWLQDLRYKQLEEQQEGRAGNGFLNDLTNFINQEGFLPHQTRLDNISSDDVEFIDGNGNLVWIEDLSDGYRSILSMTFELIRQLSLVYGQEAIFDKSDPTRIGVPGVVLIDEVDTHLHPTWQRRVGTWLREHFPNIQFIVTTHSPLVCQAANVGTVYRLPEPSSNEEGEFVTGIQLDRLLYGNVLDAYSTELFGDSSRSEEGKRRLKRLAELNQKELRAGLTEDETHQRNELRASMPTSANSL